ncbi:MAG TPA: histone deacetylase [Firmicutes bacterium]|nr:histone deacetylase [Bacillota bacterium]
MQSSSRNKVGLVFFPAFDWCITPDHPEREERLLYTRDQIVEEGLLDVPGIEEFRPRVAEDVEISRAHVCVPSVGSVITQSHRIAAGGTMVAADLVLTGRVSRSFALLRPPGHHANRIVHGSRGFCTINNEAIMVEHVRRTYGSHLRIAIVDTDAHHADGTQDIFYNDPGILHISLHQDGRTLYPGTGFIHERGGPAAYGQTVNVPLPPGTGDEGVLYVIENLVLPILADFEPDLVINAAGQDNHYTDPLTNMQVTAQGYARLTELLSPDIVVLEGGYSIEGALPYVNAGLLLALAGLDYSAVREPDWSEEKVKQPPHISETIEKTVAQLWQMWRTRKDVDLERIFGHGPFFTRQRRIYYDTDNITEEQVEKIRLCPACSGWRVIQSGAARGWGVPLGRVTVIAAVLIPWHACEDCRREADEEFDRLQKSGRFRYVYLQDVERDIYKRV